MRGGSGLTTVRSKRDLCLLGASRGRPGPDPSVNFGCVRSLPYTELFQPLREVATSRGFVRTNLEVNNSSAFLRVRTLKARYCATRQVQRHCSGLSEGSCFTSQDVSLWLNAAWGGWPHAAF